MKGLNALIATVSTPLAAPVIAATRLRKGSANSTRGAARLVADALITARAAGAGGRDGTGGGMVLLRADSAFYGHDIIATAPRHDARFSITARRAATVQAAISRILDTAWTAIPYTDAVGMRKATAGSVSPGLR